MVTAYKIELLVLDLNDEGIDNILDTLRYSVPFTSVKAVISKEIDWYDEHPLNYSSLDSDRFYQELFS